MAASLRFLGLLALMAAALLYAPSDADVRPPSTRPGLFYVFMSGQIVALDAATGAVVQSIRNFSGAPAQIPNSCPASPLQGTWNDVKLGLLDHTIFATMTFAAQGAMRQPGLQDSVVVVNATTQAIDAIIPLSGQPTAITPVPEDGTVWVHSDAAGTMNVISVAPDYSVEEKDLGKDYTVGVGGSFLTDSAMNGKGYMTSYASSGIYIYDIFARTGANFMNFQTFQVAHHSWLKQHGVHCPATHQAVYAPSSRRVFVACTRNQAAAGGLVTDGVNPGIVKMSTDTDEPVDAWPHIRADKLYVTPDEQLVVALDSLSGKINLIQPLPGVNSDQTMSQVWTPLTLPAGSDPDSMVFLPQGNFYKGYVSLLKSTLTAVIDFNQIIPCGPLCPPRKTMAAVTYIDTGLQIKGGAMNSAVTTRPIAVGHHFVCVDNAVNTTLICYDTDNPENPRRYRNMANIQQIIFVEGPYNGNEKLIPVYTSGKGISTTFTC